MFWIVLCIILKKWSQVALTHGNISGMSNTRLGAIIIKSPEQVI